MLTGHIPSLYVHFPFCEAKCHYCDFYSLGKERTRSGDADLFERALRSEASVWAGSLTPTLDSIFFGGGTPSMTDPDSMARALAPLELEKRVDPQATEWTMEANPSSVDLDRLRHYRAFGVNRISMGVQALRPDLLKDLGRVHSRETALQSLTTLFEAGFENVSVDLLCGVPNQSLGDLEEALGKLTSFPITHLSCYLLTLPPHHRMYPRLPNEDTQLSHLLLIHDWMTAQGFEHYEISNFAKPGRRARHNLNYWTGKSYLGLGPSAHSFDSTQGQRWKNVSSLHKYGSLLNQALERSPTSRSPVVEWTETLTEEQKELEKWMLALRLSDGVPRHWLETDIQQQRAESLQKQGLLEVHPNDSQRLKLTPRGFALSDHVIKLLA